MQIAFLQRTTLLDYPGKVACIVFLSGCNFRCPFCYSDELVLPEKIKEIPFIKEEDFFSFLEKRKGKLEGVVICGGEPTLQVDLPLFCQRIKGLGYLVKLDTNGSNPAALKNLLKENLVDYVALDIKTSKENYQAVVGSSLPEIAEKIEKCLFLLRESQVDFETRTTCVPGIINQETIRKIGAWLSGSQRYYLQPFLAQKTLDPTLKTIKPYTIKAMEEIWRSALEFFPHCQIR